jgi:hypothetical protein
MDSKQKWLLSLIAGLLFALIAFPFTYELTNDLFSRVGLEVTTGGGATVFGIALHSIVFALVFRLVLHFYS